MSAKILTKVFIGFFFAMTGTTEAGPRLDSKAQVSCDLAGGKWPSGPAIFNIKCSSNGSTIDGSVPNESNFSDVSYEVTLRDGTKKEVYVNVIDLCPIENETLNCLLGKKPEDVTKIIAENLKLQSSDVINPIPKKLGFPDRDRLMAIDVNPGEIPLKSDGSIDWSKVDGDSVKQLPGVTLLRDSSGRPQKFGDGKYRVCLAGGPPERQILQKEDSGTPADKSCVWDGSNGSYSSLSCPNREIQLCVYPGGSCYVVDSIDYESRDDLNKLPKDARTQLSMASCLSETTSSCKSFDRCVRDSMVQVKSGFVAPLNVAMEEASLKAQSGSQNREAKSAK